MSIEELMDIPLVSSSRQEQKISQLSTTTSIIRAEDIHCSGHTNIAEMLRFVPGVDVARLDRNHYSVGIRGLSGAVSNRVLVLINGRPINDPAFDTVDWTGYPIFIEDIDHIEIVRGPASSAWGSNAMTGVINIITKKSETLEKWFTSTHINEYGDIYHHLRNAGSAGPWRWRSSWGYDDWTASSEAGAGKVTQSGPGTLFIDDFSRSLKTDNELIYTIDEQSTVTLGGAYSSVESGPYEIRGDNAPDHGIVSTTKLFSRFDHQFDNDNSFYIQWVGDFLVSHDRRVTEDGYSINQHNIETQFNINTIDRHQLSIGGNLRWVRIHELGDGQAFLGSPLSEHWAGMFIIDHYALGEQTTLESQFRLDWYSETEMDWSGRLSLLQALDEAEKHILRFSMARAFRSPSAYLRSYVSLSSGANATLASDDLSNESVRSLEIGYQGILNEHCSLNLNAYYQEYKNLIGLVRIPGGPPPAPPVSRYVNVSSARASGIEAELEYRTPSSKLTAWYTYNHVSPGSESDDLRADFPALHKAGIRWNLDLPENWRFNTNFTAASCVSTDERGLAYPASECLDLTLSKRFHHNSGEFMIGVFDLLNSTDEPFGSIGKTSQVTTPGRTFFTRLQFTF